MTRFFKMVVGMFDVKRKKTEFATTNLQHINTHATHNLLYFVPTHAHARNVSFLKLATAANLLLSTWRW